MTGELMEMCGNCLGGGAKLYPVGPPRGTQRDPYHIKVALCGECIGHLERSRWDLLHETYRDRRTVYRADLLPEEQTDG